MHSLRSASSLLQPLQLTRVPITQRLAQRLGHVQPAAERRGDMEIVREGIAARGKCLATTSAVHELQDVLDDWRKEESRQAILIERLRPLAQCLHDEQQL